MQLLRRVMKRPHKFKWLFLEYVIWMDNTLAREFSSAREIPSIFCDCASKQETEVKGKSLGLWSFIMFLLFLRLTTFLSSVSHLLQDQFWPPYS